MFVVMALWYHNGSHGTYISAMTFPWLKSMMHDDDYFYYSCHSCCSYHREALRATVPESELKQ